MSAAEPALSLDADGAPTTRRRILAAAERAFRETGHRKTTVADIAETLEVSPATRSR